ncbi:MAG: PAS domain S-box protein [Gemmatimonadaceae bacterium]
MSPDLSTSRSLEGVALAAVLEHAPDGVFAFDSAMRVAVWNAAMEEMTGVPASAIIGRTLDGDHLAPALSTWRVHAARTLAGDTTQWLEHVTGPDGAPSARVFCARCRPMRDAARAISGGVGALRDMTDQWRLRESLEEFRAVVEQTAEAVVLADARGRITWANAAWEQMTGWPLGDAVGRKPSALLQTSETSAETRRAMREAMAAGHGFSRELLNQRRDGTPFWSRVNVTPLVANDGSLRAWVGIKHDVTEAREREARLRADRALANALMGSFTDGMFAVDRRLRILEWNRVSEEWTGLSREAVVGRPIDEVLPIERSLERRAQLMQLLEDGRTYQVVGTFAPPTATAIRYIESTLSAVRDEAGAIIGARCTGRDLTEQHRAEQALRASEERAHAIVHNAANVILGLHPDGTVFEWNTAAELMFGVSKSEMLGQSYVERFVPLEFRAFVLADVAKVLGGTPSRGVINAVTRPDGSTATLRWNVSRLDAGAGTPTGLIAVGDDITEQHAADERFRILFEASAQAIFLSDESGIIDCNEAAVRMIGATDKTHALRVALSELLPDAQPNGQSSRARQHEMLEAVRRAGQHRMDWLLRRQDGTEFHADVTIREVRLGANRMRLFILHDVSERRAAELQLAEARDAADAANHAKSAFLARMSHELRTPLNSIIGFTTLVRKRRADSLAPMDLEYLKRVESNGIRLLTLVNDILDLAKIEAGKLDMHLAPTDLHALVRECVLQCEGYPRAAAVTLRTEMPATLPLATTDGPRVRQILLNLISNALKFTSQGEVVVRVITSESGAPMAIEVADTGCGIPADRLEAVFGTFEQAHSTTARDFGGSGLGLSIARALSEALGMRLDVASEIGVGTTFRLTCTCTLPSLVERADEEDHIAPVSFGAAAHVQ